MLVRLGLDCGTQVAEGRDAADAGVPVLRSAVALAERALRRRTRACVPMQC